jgi:hypothetical protein
VDVAQREQEVNACSGKRHLEHHDDICEWKNLYEVCVREKGV